MNPPDAAAFLLHLRECPELMEAAAPHGQYLTGADYDQRLEDRHLCLRCGAGARNAFTAETDIGLRWLDLCNACSYEIRKVNTVSSGFYYGRLPS